MTESEKSEIRQQFHKVADIQADSMINVIEKIDNQLPKDISAEQRKTIIGQIIQQSAETLKISTQQLAKQMMKIKPEVNNG